jgi:DNA polymerase (family 10)
MPSVLRCAAATRIGTGPRAADGLAALAIPLEVLIEKGRLTEIPGAGDAIADIITKPHRHHPSLEKLRAIPAGVLEMLTVPDLRPDKVLRLYRDLGIISLAELNEGGLAAHRTVGLAWLWSIFAFLFSVREFTRK